MQFGAWDPFEFKLSFFSVQLIDLRGPLVSPFFRFLPPCANLTLMVLRPLINTLPILGFSRGSKAKFFTNAFFLFFSRFVFTFFFWSSITLYGPKGVIL